MSSRPANSLPTSAAAEKQNDERGADQQTTILIEKDYLHFGAAHFTIFSATERENLHGHNWYVRARLTSKIAGNGLAFDYNLVKDVLKALCDELDEQVLIPSDSPHLAISESQGYVAVTFAGERLLFLPRDVHLIAIGNVTVEALADWFMERLLSAEAVRPLPLREVTIGVSSGPGQWAESTRNLDTKSDSAGA